MAENWGQKTADRKIRDRKTRWQKNDGQKEADRTAGFSVVSFSVHASLGCLRSLLCKLFTGAGPGSIHRALFARAWTSACVGDILGQREERVIILGDRIACHIPPAFLVGGNDDRPIWLVPKMTRVIARPIVIARHTPHGVCRSTGEGINKGCFVAPAFCDKTKFGGCSNTPFWGDQKPTFRFCNPLFDDRKPTCGNRRLTFDDRKLACGFGRPTLDDPKPACGSRRPTFDDPKPTCGNGDPTFDNRKLACGFGCPTFDDRKLACGFGCPTLDDLKPAYRSGRLTFDDPKPVRRKVPGKDF